MDSRDAHQLGGAPAHAAAASPLRELRGVQRALGELVADRADATVRELTPDLTRLSRAVADACSALEAAADLERRPRHDRLAELPLADDEPLAAAVLQRDADARRALVREWGAWSATELADRAGAKASDRSALASAWRGNGRVVGVDWNGRTVYPAFQLAADGQPRPVIGRVLAHLRRAGLTDWQAMLWFTSPTAWLEDRRPVDLLDAAPAAVEGAAAGFGERPTSEAPRLQHHASSSRPSHAPG
jgi:hypothetical protein